MGTVKTLTITFEDNGTLRQNVSDYLIHMEALWMNDSGSTHTFTQDRYLLGQLNWLITNEPQAAKRVLLDLVYRIERVRQGVDEAADL